MENVNHLRTMWMESPQKRLAMWREFRKSLELDNLRETCEKIDEWWSYAPQSNLSLDPYDVATWPSVWEMLHRGDFCKFSTAIGMSYTFHYLDENIKNDVLIVHDHKHEDIYMTALIDDSLLLNYNTIEVASWNEVNTDLEIKERWTCHDIVNSTSQNS